MDYDLNYQEDTGDVDVDAIPNKIGDVCQESGTYECNTCGEEIEVSKSTRFPACTNCGDEYLTWVLLNAA
jgi:peptide subunit release factor 1 (eRF1)